MSRARRTIIGLGGAAVWLLAFGFVMFGAVVMRAPEGTSSVADGIVVLTGGETRIAEGARLLGERRGGRMLISGVNRRAGRDELLKISGLGEQQFDCCVDLGYAALDTVGNAEETRDWAAANGFDSLIVVTASYHMPRSMAELRRVLPGARLIPHPVVPKSFRQNAWWLHFGTTRTLVSEYLKFLPSAARFGVARALAPFNRQSVAGTPARHQAGL
ncbi:MAG: YdcF family protein [Hyphomicrobium sp.]